MQWKWNFEITRNHVISPLKGGCLGRDNSPTGGVKEPLELGAETGGGEEKVRVHQSE